MRQSLNYTPSNLITLNLDVSIFALAFALAFEKKVKVHSKFFYNSMFTKGTLTCIEIEISSFKLVTI